MKYRTLLKVLAVILFFAASIGIGYVLAISGPNRFSFGISWFALSFAGAIAVAVVIVIIYGIINLIEELL